MKSKVLQIGVIEKEGFILMRKKPEGSEPYKETWYSFGGDVEKEGLDICLVKAVKELSGLDIKVSKRIGWDTEVKKDHDGEEKLFIYLDTICEYIEGEIEIHETLEDVRWIKIEELGNYDIAPPSMKLFKKLGYL